MAKRCFFCCQAGELYYCRVFDIHLCYGCLQYLMDITGCEDFCMHCLYTQ